MARSTHIVLALFAAVAAAGLWLLLTYGFVSFFALVFDIRDISDGARTALTAGVLGAAMAGAVAAGMAGFFLVAGDSQPAGTSAPDRDQ